MNLNAIKMNKLMKVIVLSLLYNLNYSFVCLFDMNFIMSCLKLVVYLSCFWVYNLFVQLLKLIPKWTSHFNFSNPLSLFSNNQLGLTSFPNKPSSNYPKYTTLTTDSYQLILSPISLMSCMQSTRSRT